MRERGKEEKKNLSLDRSYCVLFFQRRKNLSLLIVLFRIACSASSGSVTLVAHRGLEPIQSPILLAVIEESKGWMDQTTFKHAQQGLARKQRHQLEASFIQTCLKPFVTIKNTKKNVINRNHPEPFFTSLLLRFSRFLASSTWRHSYCSPLYSQPLILQLIFLPFHTPQYPPYSLFSLTSYHQPPTITIQCQ